MLYLVAAFILLGTSFAIGAEPTVQAPPFSRPNGPPFTEFVGSLCSEIRSAAAANDLPAGFLTRLIWQESRFNPNAVSQGGAHGIAQFMPATARWRGLINPFDPYWSVRESARWLGELRTQFGNLGLAAAAYNAGPRRIQDWLTRKRDLPKETKAYVRIVTGRTVEEWARPDMRDDGRFPPNDCKNIALSLVASILPPENKKTVSRPEEGRLKRKWSIQLIGDVSKTRALEEYENLRNKFSGIIGSRTPMVVKRHLGGHGRAFWYQIRIADDSREGANALCSRLKSVGSQCLVLYNDLRMVVENP